MATSVFTRIIRGELPCHKILENDLFFAFLEIKPLKTGHTLVIPKVETDYIFDMDDAALGGLMIFAKKVSKAVKQAIPCKKIGVVVYGLEVRHAHIHLIPVDGMAGEIDFSKAKPVQDADLAVTAAEIRSYLS